jgi:hypothetical protein
VSKIGKREGLVYLVIFLWILMGILGIFKQANFQDLAFYFGSLTAYVATYIWGETKRPSSKTSIIHKGPTSRREIMIYFIVGLWTIVGVLAIWHYANINDMAVYFVSLSGFVASWIAGEVYTPQDNISQ